MSHFFWYLPKTNENMSTKSLKKIHGSFIHNSPKFKTSQISIHWINKLWHINMIEKRTEFLKMQPLKSHTKYIYTVWFYLYDALEQMRLINDGMVKYQNSGCLWEVGQGLTEKAHEGVSGVIVMSISWKRLGLYTFIKM